MIIIFDRTLYEMYENMKLIPFVPGGHVIGGLLVHSITDSE